MAALEEKLLILTERYSNLRSGIGRLEGKGDLGGWTWDVALKAVHQIEDALREVRKVVRSRATKEKRGTCAHPDSHRNVEGSCGKCGQTKLDPTPANVLCDCGHPRFQHHTDSKESCRFFHNGTGLRCDGFKPAAEADLKDCPNPDCFRLNQDRPEPISVRIGALCPRCGEKVELTPEEEYDREQAAGHVCGDECREHGCRVSR